MIDSKQSVSPKFRFLRISSECSCLSLFVLYVPVDHLLTFIYLLCIMLCICLANPSDSRSFHFIVTGES